MKKGLDLEVILKEQLENRIAAFSQYVRECLIFGSMRSFDEQTELLKLFLKTEINRKTKKEE
jgi:hypothetical protein